VKKAKSKKQKAKSKKQKAKSKKQKAVRLPACSRQARDDSFRQSALWRGCACLEAGGQRRARRRMRRKKKKGETAV
jgi:hypothetical protein